MVFVINTPYNLKFDYNLTIHLKEYIIHKNTEKYK